MAFRWRRFVDSNQSFHIFSLAFYFLPVWSAAEGQGRNRVNLLLYATLIWLRLCIVRYRKERTLWSQRLFHIERQVARKSSPYNSAVAFSTITAYRNLGISANLPRHLLFRIMHKCKKTTFHGRYSSLKLFNRLYFMSTVSNPVCFVFPIRSSLLVYLLKMCMKTAYLLSI